MIASLIYSGVATGVWEVTGKFWMSWLWPYHLGKLIGQALKART